MHIRKILDKAAEERISSDEAALLFQEAGLLDLAEAADAACKKKHPEQFFHGQNFL